MIGRRIDRGENAAVAGANDGGDEQHSARGLLRVARENRGAQPSRTGARDFIEKPYTNERMIEAVSAALASGRLDLPRARRSSEARMRVARLSAREHDVLRELVAGRPNKLVAHALSISPRTVEIHRANMMEKLGVRSLSEAVRIFIAAGLDG